MIKPQGIYMHRSLTIFALLGLSVTGCWTAPEPLFPSGDAAELELAESMAAAHMRTTGVDAFEVRSVFVDELGMAHARVQQLEQGVSVLGGEAIVHISPRGDVTMTDALAHNLSISVLPSITASAAASVALGTEPGPTTMPPKASLFVTEHKGTERLVWQVTIDRLDADIPARPVVLVDAHTGEVLLSYNDLHTTSGTGTGTYNGSVSIDVSSSGSSYILYDTGRNVYTKDANNRTRSFSRGSNISSSSTSFGSTDPEGVDAHYALEQSYDYFSTTFGRDSFDGSGGQIQAQVHYGRRYVNAFWDGSSLAFGDGDGSNADALTTVDIAAHEFSHALTDYTANLTYYGESGALNEATSDIFAAAIEAYVDGSTSSDTYDIGEDCWTPRTSGDALRYMDNPTADGSSYDYYPTRYTGSSDSGGVHWNSGIANLAFYLAAEGGSHPRGVTSTSVAGIGIDDAAKVWYRALTVYMTSSTDFADARDATLDAAADLYGSTSSEHDAWADAWAAVGVGSSSGGGGGGGGDTGPTDTGTTDTGDTGTTDTGGGGGGGGLDCTDGTLVSGTLAAGAADDWSLTSASTGTHGAVLAGPSSADFDLYLYKVNKRGRYSTLSSSTDAGSDETISYSLTKSSDLVWRVSAYSGSGDYELCVTVP